MKNTFILLICSLLLFLQNGCRESCRNVTCLNGGTCEDGDCICPFRYGGRNCELNCNYGYEGLSCATEVRQKYIRTWNATTTSSLGTVNHPLYITKTQGNSVQTFIIENFNNEGYGFRASILSNTTFEILEQKAFGNDTSLVSGSGYLNGENLAINLVKNGVTYFAICNK